MIIFYNRKLKKNVWDDIKKKVTDYRNVSSVYKPTIVTIWILAFKLISNQFFLDTGRWNQKQFLSKMGANIHIDLQNFHWRDCKNHYNDFNEAATTNIFSMRGHPDPVSYSHTRLSVFQGNGKKIPVGNANPPRHRSNVFLLFLARNNRVIEKGWFIRTYPNLGVFCSCFKHTHSLCRMHNSNEKHEQVP